MPSQALMPQFGFPTYGAMPLHVPGATGQMGFGALPGLLAKGAAGVAGAVAAAFVMDQEDHKVYYTGDTTAVDDFTPIFGPGPNQKGTKPPQWAFEGQPFESIFGHLDPPLVNPNWWELPVAADSPTGGIMGPGPDHHRPIPGIDPIATKEVAYGSVRHKKRHVAIIKRGASRMTRSAIRHWLKKHGWKFAF